MASDGFSDVDGSFLVQFAIVITCVLALVLVATKLYDRFWPQAKDKVPQPFSVKRHDDLATKKELEAVEKRIEVDIKSIRDQIAADRKESRDGQGKIHDRIDAAVSKVSEMDGKVDTICENVSKLLDHAINGNSAKK